MARTRDRIGLPVVSDPEVPLYTGHLDGRLEGHLKLMGRNRNAQRYSGGFSEPGKMPCLSWGISAARCRIGSILAGQDGTVCHDCYARKRNYLRDTVQHRLEQRYEALMNTENLWVPAMIFMVNYFCDQYFRLFDSGDLQGANMLRNICTIAEHTPDVRIWLPTREIETVRAVLKERVFPENLVVRVSGNMVGGEAPRGFQYTSIVVHTQEEASCPAHLQGNKCDGEIAQCRACWHDDETSYPLH